MYNDLQIIHLTKSELRVSIKEDLYWSGSISMMPKSKAKWLLNNNRIEEEDYCGVLGVENKEIVAFVYLLPDLIRTSTNTIEKVYWELLWWVDAKYKNSILGTYIYKEAVDLVGQKMILKSFAENVNDFYAKQPFDIIASRVRYTIFFSVDDEMLISRFNFLSKLKFLIKPVNKLSAYLFNSINDLRAKKTLNNAHLEVCFTLASDTLQFVKKACENDFVVVDQEYLKWQLDPRQYQQVNKQTKYLIPGASPNIKLKNITIKKEGKIIGFISFLINYSECNVKYFLVDDVSCYEYCVAVFINAVIQEKAIFVFTDDTDLASEITKKYNSVFVYKQEKKSLAHKNLNLGNSAVTILNHNGHFY